jgi:hypothetical protein
MSGRENPVTRPSVFRTQDAHNGSFGTDYTSPNSFVTPYGQPFTPQSHTTAWGGSERAAIGAGAAPTRFSPTSAGVGVTGRQAFVDALASAEALSRPFTSTSGGADSFNGALRATSSTSPGIGIEGPQRQPSVRTFSQLSAALPIASPTSTFYSADAPLPGWADYNRAMPMSPGESSVNALWGGGEALLQRPLGPDTLREAVYAYLESTDQHDVVVAMLADERRHSQRSLGATAAATSTAAVALSASPLPSGDAPSSGGAAGGQFVPLPSTSQGHTVVSSAAGVSSSASHPLSPLLREPGAQSGGAGGTPYFGGGLDARRGRQRRSHDLLRKGMLDRRASERLHREELVGAGGGERTSSRSSPRRGHASAAADPSMPPSSPDAAGRGGGTDAAAATGVHLGKPPPTTTQRQHLPKILPTLCGLEEAVRPDLILLFSDLEAKITEQYRQLNIPLPSHEVLQYILSQAYEPMWSVGEDANAYHLFEPANPVTGMVLYGTLNQMVEQLTRVYVMPLTTPPDIIIKSGRSFCEAFLRRHRMLLPSHVLLAKLMERYLVPLSLHLGFERFQVHGITVHLPGTGASLPPRRSQSETVLHGRRHPGATSPAGGGAMGSTSVGGAGNTPGGAANTGESGVWGSRSARVLSPPSPQQQQRGAAGGGGRANCLNHGTNAVVEEYVRATAAATSPDAALIAMMRSGMLPAVSNDSLVALANTAIGTAPASTLTSYPASTFLPSRGGSGGFPNAAASVAGGLGGIFNSGNGAANSRPPVELVTTYSPSATLWLTVCERVQLKVLSVLLYWLQHHPHHFDDEMLRSVLHFVESCCYNTCKWADCPSRQPQIAEFIRQACHAALPLSFRRFGGLFGNEGFSPLSTAAGATPSTQLSALPPISKEWRDGVLSGTWERRRLQLLSEAIPPTLRHSVKPELLPWTWITPMGLLTPRQYLPCFAFRTLPTADVLSYPGEERHQPYYQHGHHRHHSAGSTTQVPSDMKGGAYDGTTLHNVAQEALRLFGSCTFETYVRGLTAAHYRMFTAFPSQDIFIAAHYTNSSYLTSPAFQASFLGRFLNSSAVLTAWCVSLLLHAAYLDGERAAAVVAVANLSILNTFVGDTTDYGAAATTSEGDAGDGEGGGAAGGHSPHNSRSSSISLSNSPLSSASAATASAAAVSQSGTGGNMNTNSNVNNITTLDGADAAASARHGGLLHNPARQFLQVLDRLVDLVIGFLRVNNLHASYSVFRGFKHPFLQKLLRHRRISAHIHAQTAHRIRKLEGLFTSIPPTSASAEASQASGRAVGSGSPGSGGAKRQSATAAAAAGVKDPAVDDDLSTSGNDGFNAAKANGPTSPMSDTAPRRNRKCHHSFFEYLNTVPDSVEYPTVPVVQYYLRELQMLFALEPTFFTVPSHQMQSRFVSEEVRLAGVFTMPSAGLEEELHPTAASPIAVVNWRKMHLVDDWIQRVNGNQMSCLHYISSRSTVVRHIMPDLDFEKAFDTQLSRVVVTNTTLLQEMANRLYSVL